jgi:hypothetical protein
VSKSPDKALPNDLHSLYKQFYTLNVASCPLATGTPRSPIRDLCHGQIWRNFTSPPVQMQVHSCVGADANIEMEQGKGGAKHDRWFSPLLLPCRDRLWSRSLWVWSTTLSAGTTGSVHAWKAVGRCPHRGNDWLLRCPVDSLFCG